jgi:prepilin-type N-terminal cleavage/methylation domain-containing protein
LAKAQAKHVGFTLIELLVTLVIVSVLAAATLPAFKNVIVERKTSVAALEVKAFLDAARARAIARGRPVSVILERLSSRSDGLGIDGTPAYLPDNPFRSITAQNPSAPLTSTLPWTTGDATTNFGVYNACIRMVMAESMRPIEFELTGVSFVSETAGGVPPILNDGDGLVELGRIMVVPNNDNRLATNLRVGNEIEILTPSDDTIRFLITNVVLSGTNFFVSIRNEGSLSQPYGTILDVNRMASSQEMVSQFAFINSIGSFRVLPQPRPVASMVTELPRGSCIDLSLSGLSNDDPNVNPTNNLFRDCRREFASDWVLPRTPAFNDLPPLPSQLRPVYLTFGPTGKLSSVLCNAPQLAAPSGNPASYTSNLRRIEPQSDVCLFVGRNDQVIAAASTADLAAAEDASLKPNLMDATGYWIRVSPTSGIISAAPAQASHIIEDVADFRGGNPPEPIGHLLEDSRSLIFEAELTSQ